MATKQTIFLGSFVHSKSLTELEIVENGAIGVDEKGVIRFVEKSVASLDEVKSKAGAGWENAETVTVKKGGWLFPGFIDTHIHASQYPNTGIFGKSTLLDWLNTYTFPLESSYKSLPLARRIYSRVVARTLAHGTTTATYYATVHVPATNLLADICLSKGQRAFVGRVCMNQLSPSYYQDESVDAAVQASRECIQHARTIDPNGDIVRPIITPRFAPSCTSECMRRLADLQQETDTWAQTHISENPNEIKLVQEMFPDSTSYTDVYSSCGLLTEKMILAHAVHLSHEEKELIKSRGAKISHCPASNTALTSGDCKVRDLLDRGIDVGLGTDVSGGFSASILEMVRHAIWTSRHVAMRDGDAFKLSTAEALYLSTRGGAKVVGLEDKVGGFEVGKEFDAQLIGFDVENIRGKEDEEMETEEELEGFCGKDGPVDMWGWEGMENRVEKWVYNGDDRNTLAVWVKGRLVHARKEFSA